MRVRGLLVLLVVLAVGAVIAGCGDDADESSQASGGGGGKTLSAGTITGVLPYQSLDEDGKTVIGFEPELFNEAAKRIDMKPKITITEFDSLLPALDSKRFDVVFAGMIDKAEREKGYDAINITRDKFTWAAKSDLAAKVKSFDDMCGYKVGVLAGSAYLETTEAAAKKCEAKGNKMTLRFIDNDAQGFLALKAGQVDFWPGNLPLVVQYGKDNPGFGAVGFTMLPGPTAMYVAKGSPLTKKLQTAFQEMVDDGTYDKILDKWDVGDIGIDKILVNPVTTGQVEVEQ